MAPVAWILAVFGARLAFALCAGSAIGAVRQIDRASAIAVFGIGLVTLVGVVRAARRQGKHRDWV